MDGSDRQSALLGAARHDERRVCANSLRENHVLTGTLTGPFAHVTTSVEMPGTPPSMLQDYAANETRENGAVTFLAIGTPARRSSPARRR
jgi:hypothetical protein